MTTGTFNFIKIVLMIWMVLILVGSFLFILDGEGIPYLIEPILAVITIWFLTQVKVKEGPSKPEELNQA